MKGGARARSGPAPDPDALRRDRDGAEWVTLPADGRQGAAPSWPLPGQSDRETELWSVLWAMPQAVEWEAQHQFLEVANYVRRQAEAEVPGSPVSAGALVKQLAENLGLSLPGMSRLKWRIAASDAVKDQAVAPRSSLALLSVVQDGA